MHCMLVCRASTRLSKHAIWWHERSCDVDEMIARCLIAAALLSGCSGLCRRKATPHSRLETSSRRSHTTPPALRQMRPTTCCTATDQHVRFCFRSLLAFLRPAESCFQNSVKDHAGLPSTCTEKLQMHAPLTQEQLDVPNSTSNVHK